ncbi:unnamed protein product [Ilex paraguariensis]|uniref:Glycosyltransferase n=1 Tax=Ilex paraguariensis TaxID=185542 RepID=A0ABC8QTF2_9AQUA
MGLLPSLMNVTVPLFKEMMVSRNFLASENRRSVACIISDGVFSFAIDFAIEKGISIVYFRTISACSFWAYFRIHELIEADELPVKGKGMDLLVKRLPGTEGFLRRRDLPGFCRVDYIDEPKLQGIKFETRQTARAHAAILNTFEDLEGPILSHIRTQIPNLYSIGPLHSLLKSRLETTTKEFSESSGSLWEEDRSCLTWLDSQPPKSVIYVSFGSITIVTRDQLLEFWYGLVNSGQRFLWVMRPDSITGNDGESQIPTELEEATKARGYTVDWAPQEEVLNHPAIGGFVTHSGWNSTLESIVAGVPMICWPYFADQTTNSRFVSEVWEIGLDMKDTCDRVVIEKMVREVMDVKKEEFLERADQLAKLARKSVSEGGSSCCNFERFVEYISGWNSTLESIVAGVPMTCWSYYADQQVNSRLVGEVWKIGMDTKDTCDRVMVEKMIGDLMGVTRDEFFRSANQRAKLARRSVAEGGSPYCSLDRWIEDTKLMTHDK